MMNESRNKYRTRRHSSSERFKSSISVTRHSSAEERPREEETKDEVAETEGEHHAESSPVPPVARESDSTNPLPSVQEQAPKSENDYATAEKDMLEENGKVVVECIKGKAT
jgi:hypothetical protein